MSHESFPATGPDSMHADSGDPNRDRADLASQAPAELDEQKIQEHADGDGDEAGTDADAARS